MTSQAPLQTRHVLQWQNRATRRVADQIVTEEPLEIQVDTRSVVVTMRTPGHDHELSAGFLLGEGVVKKRADLLNIVPYVRNPSGNVIDVFLADDVRPDFSQLTRNVYASSSCGLCGKASIEAVRRHFKKIQRKLTISAKTLLTLPDLLRRGQETFSRTGGLHAAGIFNSRGKLIVLREDVGRHNAVDKVLGHGLLNGLLPFDRHILMVSGRASFEILQKSLAARIPIVASVSAPSSLAVEFAVANRQTLIGFLREDRFNIYSHPERVK